MKHIPINYCNQLKMGTSFTLVPRHMSTGTPAIAEAVGLGAACEYLRSVGMDKVYEHDLMLGLYLYEELSKLESLTLYGPKPDPTMSSLTVLDVLRKRAISEGRGENLANIRHTEGIRTGVVAFNCKSIHPTDLSFFLDQEGVALRTGHHCTQPLHRQLGMPASIRASVYLYNDKHDVDVLVQNLKETVRMFSNLN